MTVLTALAFADDDGPMRPRDRQHTKAIESHRDKTAHRRARDKAMRLGKGNSSPAGRKLK